VNNKPPENHVSVTEARQMLGVAKARMYQLIELGRIESYRTPDGRIWIPVPAIERRLAGRQRLSSSQCIRASEVAEFFGVDVKTVREWHAGGLLRATKIENTLCFAPGDVIKFVPPTIDGPGRPTARKPTHTLRGRHYGPAGSDMKGTTDGQTERAT
jgi:hypothetical protein